MTLQAWERHLDQPSKSFWNATWVCNSRSTDLHQPSTPTVLLLCRHTVESQPVHFGYRPTPVTCCLGWCCLLMLIRRRLRSVVVANAPWYVDTKYTTHHVVVYLTSGKFFTFQTWRWCGVWWRLLLSRPSFSFLITTGDWLVICVWLWQSHMRAHAHPHIYRWRCCRWSDCP